MAEGTMIDMGDGFGGMSLLSGGAGFVGGLVLGSLWNGNGPWGGRGNAGVGYDTGAINAIQGQLSALQGQVANADRDLLLQTSNQNQFTGNLINATGDAITNAVNSANVANIQAQNAANVSNLQARAASDMAMQQGFCGVTNAVNTNGAAINRNIIAQNYENRLQAQQLAAQQQQCCCQVLQKVEQEGCANRELQRQIQTEAIQSALADSKAQNAALMAQINLQQQLATSQTAQTAQILAAMNTLCNSNKSTTAGA